MGEPSAEIKLLVSEKCNEIKKDLTKEIQSARQHTDVSTKKAKTLIISILTGIALLFGILGYFGIKINVNKAVDEITQGKLNDAVVRAETSATQLDDRLKAWDSKDPLNTLFKQKECKNITINSCSDSSWLKCPEGYYVAAIYNAGGSNSCARKIQCCPGIAP